MAEQVSTMKLLTVSAPCGFVFTTWIQEGRRDSCSTFTEYGQEQTMVFEDLEINFDIEVLLLLEIYPRVGLAVERRAVSATAVYLQTIENGGMHVYARGEESDQFLLNANDAALRIIVIE